MRNIKYKKYLKNTKYVLEYVQDARSIKVINKILLWSFSNYIFSPKKRTFKREKCRERYESHWKYNNNSGSDGDTTGWVQESEKGLQTLERGQPCTVVRN